MQPTAAAAAAAGEMQARVLQQVQAARGVLGRGDDAHAAVAGVRVGVDAELGPGRRSRRSAGAVVAAARRLGLGRRALDAEGLVSPGRPLRRVRARSVVGRDGALRVAWRVQPSFEAGGAFAGESWQAQSRWEKGQEPHGWNLMGPFASLCHVFVGGFVREVGYSWTCAACKTGTGKQTVYSHV